MTRVFTLASCATEAVAVLRGSVQVEPRLRSVHRVFFSVVKRKAGQQLRWPADRPIRVISQQAAAQRERP